MAAHEKMAVERKSGENLTDRVAIALRGMITADKMQPGDKLPTERALIESFGVSRTVVREALSRLQADGLVESRQGAGVFVRRQPDLSGQEGIWPGKIEKISEILEILELRAAVEIEAAGLAADRRSFAQEAKIKEAYDDITASIDHGSLAEDQDYAFHLAIAEASGNRYFVDFLNFLGKRTIPRAEFLRQGYDLTRQIELIRDVHAEHLQILRAISNRDIQAAREAMRTHLVGSRERYRALMYEEA